MNIAKSKLDLATSKAAELWISYLHDGKWDTGDDQLNEETKKYQAPVNGNTDAFKSLVQQFYQDKIAAGETRRILLEIDYEPDKNLTPIINESGLNPRSFPIKTFVRIDIDYDEVTVTGACGYGSPCDEFIF